MRPASLPLFPEPLTFMRPHIAGWAEGDVVMFPDPKARDLQRKGRVLTSFPKSGTLLLRAECPDAIVEIEPERCRLVRRSLGEGGKVTA